jgi:hypothetical protein
MKERMWFVRYSFTVSGIGEEHCNSFMDNSELPFLVWLSAELKGKDNVTIHEVTRINEYNGL